MPATSPNSEAALRLRRRAGGVKDRKEWRRGDVLISRLGGRNMVAVTRRSGGREIEAWTLSRRGDMSA